MTSENELADRSLFEDKPGGSLFGGYLGEVERRIEDLKHDKEIAGDNRANPYWIAVDVRAAATWLERARVLAYKSDDPIKQTECTIMDRRLSDAINALEKK